MEQSKLGSLIEAITHTAVGFVISILLSIIVYPAFGHAFTLAENAGITAIFTAASIIRGYVIRRFFAKRFHAAALRMARAVS